MTQKKLGITKEDWDGGRRCERCRGEKRENGDKKGNGRRKERRKRGNERKRRQKGRETGMEYVARGWKRNRRENGAKGWEKGEKG